MVLSQPVSMWDTASDVSVIAVYLMTLCVRDMSWVFTGCGLAVRSMFGRVDTVAIAISALQLSDTCDNTRVLLRGPSVYIIGLFVFSLACLSRHPLFAERTCNEKKAFVCVMMTVALSTRGSTKYRILFNTMKAATYMVLCRVSDSSANTWDIQARVCWCLSAYNYPMLLLAVMQVAFDAEAYVITVKRRQTTTDPRKQKSIETWDVTV